MPGHLFRDSAPPFEVTNSKDSHIFSGKKKILDFVMGWCVGNAGWNKKELLKAIRQFNGPVYVTPLLGYKRWEILADKLANLMPNKEGICFRATGGTEAVELALKISRAYNGREKFIAFDDAYHGQSFMGLGLVGLHKDKFGPYPDWFIRIEAKDWARTTKEVVARIEKGDVCAFISEPILCNKGVIVPPSSFFQAVRNTCTKTKTVFIMDEVATGFARTGKWFGFEHHGVEPDIITIAKGFSSGYAAIGATIAKPEIAKAMQFPFSNYSTFGWHPISTEIAIASMDYLQKKKAAQRSERMGTYLRKRLEKYNPEGTGLCLAVPCEKDISGDCLRDGLLVDYFVGRVLLLPALDVSKKEIDEAITILQKHLPKKS